jgi:urease accessory protein
MAKRFPSSERRGTPMDSGAEGWPDLGMNVTVDGEARSKAPPQRASGSARLTVSQSGGQSHMARLYQQGSAKIRMSSARPGATADAVMVNTAGGLAGGDRFDWAVDVSPGAGCRVVSAACEKVYRSEDDSAEVRVALDVGEGASLDWLPQETIVFDNARLDRTLRATLAPMARFLALEAVILGRRAMGETVRLAALRDRWRVWRGGRLIFADNFQLGGDVAAVTRRKATLNGAGGYASLLFVADQAERRLGDVRDALKGAGGASGFDGKLFCRILAPDGMALRAALTAVLAALGQDPLPRAWTV